MQNQTTEVIPQQGSCFLFLTTLRSSPGRLQERALGRRGGMERIPKTPGRAAVREAGAGPHALFVPHECTAPRQARGRLTEAR